MDINNENQNKKRLGRGLSSLFSEGSSETSEYSGYLNEKSMRPAAAGSKEVTQEEYETKIWKIAIDKIVPGAYQPRKSFNKDSIQQLADSIMQNGLLQPITVRKRKAGGFEIIAGERRWRAAQVAGLHEVAAIIKTVSDKEALQLAIIENVQREDLDPIEEAEGYQRLINEFNLSQQEVSEKVGKERSTIANALRLISLPIEIKDMVAKKSLSVGHAKALLATGDTFTMVQLAKEGVAKGWSVRALEAEIKQRGKKEQRSSKSQKLDINISSKLVQELAEQIQKKLGTKAEIIYKSGKGQIVLHFYSDDQLTQIYEKINN